MNFTDIKTTRLLAMSLAAATCLSSAVFAQEYKQEDEQLIPTFRPGENLSFEAGIDVTTAYFYRGISQGRQNYTGAIIQPYASLDLGLYDDETVTVNGHIATWNSFSTMNRPAGNNNAWYESDIAIGFTIGLPKDNLALDVTYIWLENPQGGAEFNQEIDISLAYDDSEFWSTVAETKDIPGFEGFQPYALLAYETSGAADAIAEDSGVYLEFGIEPSMTLIDSKTLPITFSLPAHVGLNVSNYYQTAPGDDSDFFGYLDVGAKLSAPMTFIPKEYGNWDMYVGVDFLIFSDQLREISSAAGTGNSTVQVIGTFGMSMSF
ncbi:hypothetical protein [Poriferisphaera sp. WC338]|uniref:hypothetical protein n=1 Tax=Poriferisphaera sp. WC338 TaxID=3425129 RepID=UPI003D81BAE4